MELNSFIEEFSVKVIGKCLLSIGGVLLCTQKLISLAKEQDGDILVITEEYADIILKSKCTCKGSEYYDFTQEVIYKDGYDDLTDTGIVFECVDDGLYKLGEAYFCAKKPRKIERISDNESRADYGDYLIICTSKGSGGKRTDIDIRVEYKEGKMPSEERAAVAVADFGESLYAFGENIFNTKSGVKMVRDSDNSAHIDFENYTVTVTTEGSGGERSNICWKRVFKEAL